MKLILLSIASFALGAVCFAGVTEQDRAADAAAIRAHIGSIFQAFIDGNEQKIFDTHSEDWRGLLEGTPTPIKGIGEYMRANGIDWPKPANAPKSEPYYPPGTGYKMNDFDVHFYNPELAVANFIGEFVNKEGETLRRFRIMDIYAKRKGNWIQVASHTAIDPAWRDQQTSMPRNITPDIRQRILAKRDAVWKAWFANDRPVLEKMIPAEAIAINSGSQDWSDRAAILAGAKAFADSGSKLVRLEFPKTEIQAYGNTIIVYTSYIYETDDKGKRTTVNGRGTEIFVRRGDELVNVGWHLDDGN
ncbi:MAG TPA: nuclear transport factor 2 family protein [Pyrinomonadaceae bacterium]|nr:nuclear transport factor 2 family protein [Pyrinomonadaceae bacterium]